MSFQQSVFQLSQFLFWGFVSLIQLFIAIFDTETFLRFYSQSHHEEFFEKIFAVAAIKSVILLIAAVFFWRLSVFYAVKNYFSDRLEGQVSLSHTSSSHSGLSDLCNRRKQRTGRCGPEASAASLEMPTIVMNSLLQ